MSSSDRLTVRPLRREEMEFAIDLAAGEGWNPGQYDAESFHVADPQGFLVGELGQEKIGCICAVRYGDDFGFVGLYIVRPEFRGRGHGRTLWQAGMNHLIQTTPERNVGLDGVVDQQGNYRKSGFELAFRSVRYQGSDLDRLRGAGRSESTVDIADVDRATLADFDRTCFPAERHDFLDAWLGAPGTRALAWLDDGWLAGFGSIRPCREGWKIGPLFADHRRAAEGLFDALCASVDQGPVFFDVAETHAEAVALAESRGMEPVFETARMYTRGEPDVDNSRVWGVTTFELG